MRKISNKILFSVLLLLVLGGLFAGVSTHASARASGKKADILFLHDTHSHLDSFTTTVNGKSCEAGGFARIKTLIDNIKEDKPNALLVDAGDFSMGTLVQTIFNSDSAELRMLGTLGCEVSTLGNHEFDYRSAGLADALLVARNSGDPIPSLVLCNIDWEAMEAEGLSQEQQLLKNAFDNYGLSDYIVLTKGDTKIAVFGVFGQDSLACAPTCVLKFKDASEAAAETIAEIRKAEDVDMIICLSHGGTHPNGKNSEDEILAKKVPDIDLIISGHTHTELQQPIRHGDTYIVSCGEYGKNLGMISLEQKESGRWELTDYSLQPISSDIAPDMETQEKVDSFMEIVDNQYLSSFGYKRNQVLTQNDVVFSSSDDLYSIHTEHNLGNLLSDAFFYTVLKADTGDSHPVDVTIVPAGCVRDSFIPGNITVTDVFNAYSLGIGRDGVPGYPLISFYLTGKELMTGVEIDASVSDLMPAARLYLHGIHYSFNPHRMILNKVTDCYLPDEEGNRHELEDDKLYRIVCDLYSGQMLGAVSDVSFGILSIQPKFSDGTPIENIEDAIILSDGKEIKAWAAIADYLNSFEDTDGDSISNMPDYYHSLHDRKVITDSRNLLDLIRNPNAYSLVIYLVIIVITILLCTLTVFLIRLLKKCIVKAVGQHKAH